MGPGTIATSAAPLPLGRGTPAGSDPRQLIPTSGSARPWKVGSFSNIGICFGLIIPRELINEIYTWIQRRGSIHFWWIRIHNTGSIIKNSANKTICRSRQFFLSLTWIVYFLLEYTPDLLLLFLIIILIIGCGIIGHINRGPIQRTWAARPRLFFLFKIWRDPHPFWQLRLSKRWTTRGAPPSTGTQIPMYQV